MRTSMTTSLATLALATAACTASAQNVAFKPTLTKGATLKYELSSNLKVEQTNAGQTDLQETKHTASFTCTVESVDSDGSAEVSMMFDSLSFSIVAGEDADTFAWKFTGGDRPNAAMGEGLNASGFALAGAEISFDVSASGEISGMGGLDEFLATVASESASDVAFVGAFTPARLAEAIEPIFDADGGAAEERARGAKWSENETVDLGAIGNVVMTRDYVYLANENNMATVLGSLTVKLNKPATQPENSPTARLNGVTGAVAVQWNSELNMLEQYARTEQLGTVWEMGDVTLNQMQHSVMKIVRLD